METTPPSAPPVMGANIPPSDSDHLTLLAIFYYVMAGLQLLFGGGFGLLYLVIGLVMLSMPESMQQGPNDPENIGLIAGGVMAAVGGFVFLLSLLVGMLQIMTGNRLRKARSRTFCMIVAGITCLSVPFGTILGVFTFVVLTRPGVQARFAAVQDASVADGATYR